MMYKKTEHILGFYLKVLLKLLKKNIAREQEWNGSKAYKAGSMVVVGD